MENCNGSSNGSGRSSSVVVIVVLLVEGSLEVKLPTIWTLGKAEVGGVREEKRRREKIREEKE